jgi:hypothetical protein
VIGKDYNYFLRKCVGFHVLNQSKFWKLGNWPDENNQ